MESKYGHHFKEIEPEPYEAKLNRIDEFFEGMELELKKDVNMNSPPPKNSSNNSKNSLSPVALNINRPVPMQLENTQMIVEENSLNVLELWHETPNVVQIAQNEISEDNNPKQIIDKWITSIGQSSSQISKENFMRTVVHNLLITLLGIDTARWNNGGTTTFITKVSEKEFDFD